MVAQRSLKSPEEINEIEAALAVSAVMYREAMAMAQPGIYEREIAGRIEGIALAGGGQLAFPAIVTVHGETLHNHYHGNAPAERRPAAHRFRRRDRQRATPATSPAPCPWAAASTPGSRPIYETVLDMQLNAIAMIRPGVSYRAIHLKAGAVLVDRLKDLGLMKGDSADAVAAGAHALFFPHGLGHMMGLDVHDMEDLGEVHVGYDDKTKRSQQFGLAYLRLARKLEPGHVLTVEPGIYFIPALIDQWRASENKRPPSSTTPRSKNSATSAACASRTTSWSPPAAAGSWGRPSPRRSAEVEAAVVRGELDSRPENFIPPARPLTFRQLRILLILT